MKLLRKVSKMDAYAPVRTPEDVSREDLVKSCEEMSNRNVALMNRIADQAEQIKELSIKINNVHGVIWDYISMNGKLDNEDLKIIAEFLDMELTRVVDVEYTVTFVGTAEIPLGVDIDDIDWKDEVSFHADTVSEHNIDLTEDNVDVDVREMY